MATRKRRARTGHSGVKLLSLPGKGCVARWRDPLSGKVEQVSFDRLGLTTAEARRAWAIDRARSNKSVAAAVASGKANAEPTSLPVAVERFLAVSTARASTVAGYRPHLNAMLRWCGDAGLRLTADMQPRHLAAYRDAATAAPARVSRKGAGRGAKHAGKVRAPATALKALVVAKAFLRWARVNGLVPHLDGDAIRDNLRPVKLPRKAIAILRPAEARELVEAALRHDAATFKLTRAEHDGEQEAGSTLRHRPVAPFVLLGLLLGTRLGELEGLEWAEVDLAAREVRLPASRVKTNAARTITLDEAPQAVELLRALRLRTPGAQVFPGWSRDVSKSLRRRLVKDYGAPAFDWQSLRRTCAAVLTNAPSIYGAAAAFRSAKRAGHSVVVAERAYVDLLRDLPRDARTIEAAIEAADLCKRVVSAAKGGGRQADRGGAEAGNAEAAG